jgi:acyl-CoA synthetase (AMP-forming)/AMP-acid ligase II
MQGRKFLRTGDLGFFCAGSLYISGRLKDLIIVRGRNHYPEDIEVTVESCHPKIKGGGCAVFSISPGETISEQIAVVAEVLRRTDDAAEIHEMVQAVQKAIANAHEIHVDIVVFIAPGTIPKTSSGKIQRSACRRALLAGELNEFGRNSVGTLTNSAT